ncbi:MAG TPA: hypothetical protein VKB80_27040 [Kofleriaceae bacterium]|nr:hypothetical protein [Kofleriaceae bacterium]
MSRGGKRGVPPDLKGTLGTLIRTTINQVGAMTDVARRQARTQKQRIDTALLDRRRREALADLGESLYDLATGGEIELDELPELVRAVQAVEDIDREIAEAELAASEASQARRPVRLGRTRSGGAGWQPDRDRGREPARSGERVWRPPVDAEPAPPPAAGERGDRAAAAGSRAAGAGVGGKPSGSSGKASSSGGKASSGASSGKTSSGGASKATGSGAGGKVAATSGAGKAASNAAGGKASGGGIVFLDDDSAPSERDPDDSLESYMNEEDVPRRG